MVIYDKIPYLSITYKNMRVKTTQEQTFADSFINIPNSQLDIINKIIDWKVISEELTQANSTHKCNTSIKKIVLTN